MFSASYPGCARPLKCAHQLRKTLSGLPAAHPSALGFFALAPDGPGLFLYNFPIKLRPGWYTSFPMTENSADRQRTFLWAGLNEYIHQSPAS